MPTISRASSRPDATHETLIGCLDPEMPWAIRPSVLPAIAALMRSAPQIESVEESRVGVSAARGGQRVAGAVAIIPLQGIITPKGGFLSRLLGLGGGLEGFRENLNEALGNDDIGSIVIDVDSPGGSIELLHETAAEIFEARGTKPIVAVANTMAASAAYWLAAQADEVVVTPSGIVGSIGVFSIHDDWSKFNDGFGVLPTYISAGKYKTDGNPDEPLSDTARAAIQEMVDDYYAQFVAAVAQGRGVSESAVRSGYGEGRVLTAQRALDAGMVDRVESLEDTIGRLVAGDPTAGAIAGVGTVTAPTPEALLEALRPHLDVAAEATPDEIGDAVAALLTDTPTDETKTSRPPDVREAAAVATPPWLLLPTPRH